MSISVAGAKKCRFVSQYPVDKIVNIYTGSFTANASATGYLAERTHESIAHSYGQQCLLDLVYSLDGGTTWNDADMQIPDISTPSAPIFQTCVVAPYSTTTDFVIVASNFLTSSKTVQYILTATWVD